MKRLVLFSFVVLLRLAFVIPISLLFVCWRLESNYSKWRLEMENGQETCH